MKKRYIVLMVFCQILVTLVTFLYFHKYNKDTIGFNVLKYGGLIFTNIISIMFIINIFFILAKKNRVGNMVFKLKMFNKKAQTLQLVSSGLIILGLSNMGALHTFFIMPVSIISILMGAFILAKLYTPCGIVENGLLYFGDIYEWTSIKSGYMNKKENCIEVMIGQENSKGTSIQLHMMESNYKKLVEIFEENNKILVEK